MQRGVHGRLMDNSTSVREAAVELLGRFVLSRPQLTEQYYDMLIERILVCAFLSIYTCLYCRYIFCIMTARNKNPLSLTDFLNSLFDVFSSSQFLCSHLIKLLNESFFFYFDILFLFRRIFIFYLFFLLYNIKEIITKIKFTIKQKQLLQWLQNCYPVCINLENIFFFLIFQVFCVSQEQPYANQ